jgi:hypothetical protein
VQAGQIQQFLGRCGQRLVRRGVERRVAVGHRSSFRSCKKRWSRRYVSRTFPRPF